MSESEATSVHVFCLLIFILLQLKYTSNVYN
jgi:hypothetical protein